MPGKFQFPHSEWAIWEAFAQEGTVKDWKEAPTEFTDAIALLEDNQRALEDFLGQMSAGKVYVDIVVGTSVSGYTADEVDYLCDGADDHVEIQNAINEAAALSYNGRVILLAGVYDIRTSITTSEGVVIEGQGPNNTKLLGRSGGAGWGVAGMLIHSGGAGVGAELRNITVDKGSVAGGDAIIKWAQVGGSGGNRIHNVVTANAGGSVDLWIVGIHPGTVITDCVFPGTLQVTDNGSSSTHYINNCNIGYYSASLSGSAVISNCRIAGGALASNAADHLIHGGRIVGQFDLRPIGNKHTVIGVQVIGSGSGTGIRIMESSDDATIIGCQISGWATGIGDSCCNPITDTFIGGNRISGNTTGISIGTNATATGIVGNDLRGNTTALSDSGVGTLKYANLGITNTAGPTGLLTTKGDLLGFTTLEARVPVGANNTVLTADSTVAAGVKWATPAAAAGATFLSVAKWGSRG